MSSNNNLKLNIGCGADIKSGYINVEKSALPGVDIVHNLSEIPWPFEDSSACEILLINVLEHLPNTIDVIEEIWRILKPNGHAIIRVPYWNCKDSYVDPTHVKSFHQHTFNFFDPEKRQCQRRSYLSDARFKIDKLTVFIKIFKFYFPINNKILKNILFILSTFLCNVVWVLEFDLVRLPYKVSTEF